jgi:chlorite dismutase
MTEAKQRGEDLPVIDVDERAGEHTGNPQVLKSRLFMQLLVFDVAQEADPRRVLNQLADALRASEVPAVIYEDMNSPRGIGLLTWAEKPLDFVSIVRPTLLSTDLAALVPRTTHTMIGRTYATGFEPDLAYWLLDRPVETVLNPEWTWAVWYPLRRKGEFARLDPREQGMILKEHGTIGRAYGAQDLAHDVRLACHGLDQYDNDFVIGLIGPELHPLSHVVQSMRKTRQTSELIEAMGPFFVGRAAVQLAGSQRQQRVK